MVCDTSAFNLRFLRAAMTKLGYHQVIEAHTIDELVHKATVGQAELVVFDPAMQDGAGMDAIKDIQAAVPSALLVVLHWIWVSQFALNVSVPGPPMQTSVPAPPLIAVVAPAAEDAVVAARR